MMVKTFYVLIAEISSISIDTKQIIQSTGDPLSDTDLIVVGNDLNFKEYDYEGSSSFRSSSPSSSIFTFF